MPVLWSDDGIGVATVGNVSISVLRQPATVARLRRLRGDLIEMNQRHPGKIASITILEETAIRSAPDEIRAESASLMRDSHVFAAAIVIEGKGFRVAATRALLAGLSLVSRPRYEQKIFERVELAAQWLVEVMAKKGIPDQSSQDLVSGIEQARAAIS
jgi:hypothetical protein